MLMNRFKFSGLIKRNRRGLTLIELLVAISISVLVTSAAVTVMWISARDISDIYAQTRTRAARMRSLDQIRYPLMNALIGSVTTSNGGHTITFNDPNKGAFNSQFAFDTNTRVLTYDPDLSSSGDERTILRGPVDISFTVEDARIVRLYVKSATEMAYGDVDNEEGETIVYLRNTQ